MNPSAQRRVRVALIVLLVGVLAGAALDALGVTPWLLVVSSAFVVVVLLRQHLGWTMGIAGGVVLLLVVDLIAVRLLQPVDIGLDLKNRVVLVTVAALAWILMWRRRAIIRPVSLQASAPLLIALAPPVLITVVGALTVSLSAGSRVAWSMQNDAVWNTVTARFLWSDQGVGPDHSFVSPLIQTLLAGAFAPGRAGIPPSALLVHDVTRQAELWLLLLAAASVLTALIAWQGLARLSAIPRAIGVLAIGSIPLAWYVAGYSFQFGFFNATVALIGLLCGWIAWMFAGQLRLASVVLMSGVTLVLLGTWAPLAALPIFLGMGVLATGGRAWWRAIRGIRLWVLVLSLATIPAYLAAVTLPDVLREGKALSANGGIIAIEPRHVVIVSAVALLSTAYLAFVSPSRIRAPFVGVALLIVAAALVLAYLLVQRSREASRWGYYPQKLSWLVATLLIIIIAVTLVGIAPRRALIRRALILATAAGVVVLMCLPIPTRASITLVASALLPFPQPVSEATTARLFDASDPGQFTVFARFGLAGEDSFVNGWLIQQRATSDKDPIRAYAYSLDGTDPQQLCGLARATTEKLHVRTLDRGLPAFVITACPSENIGVIVG